MTADRRWQDLFHMWTTFILFSSIPVAAVLAGHRTGRSLIDVVGYGEAGRLKEAGRRVAIECLREDPRECALPSLSLCESDPVTAETCYKIILKCAGHLASQKLFEVAHHIDSRGYPARAFNLALLAVEGVTISFNQVSWFPGTP